MPDLLLGHLPPRATKSEHLASRFKEDNLLECLPRAPESPAIVRLERWEAQLAHLDKSAEAAE